MLGEGETYINSEAKNAQHFFDKFVQISISEVVLTDVIEAYAVQEIPEPNREKFLEEYICSPQCNFLKRAVIEVMVTVIAADEIENDEIFYKMLHLFEINEEDEVIFKMKQAMLRKMIEDASDYIYNIDEERFLARMDYTEKLFMQTVSKK